MKALLFLGPPGSGKTTLIGAILRAELLPGRTAFVFNDAGTPGTVDARMLAGLTDFRPMVGGCFGCRDAGELTDLLHRLREDAYDWIVLEPLGFVDGHEVPDILASSDVDARTITLVDARHHVENRRLLSRVVASQLAAATLAVGVTKASEGALPETIVEEIARHAPGTFVGAVPEGRVPEWLSDRLHAWDRAAHRHVCSHGHDHDHSQHDHGTEHGQHVYSFRLRPEATMKDVRGLSTLDAVKRVKGVVEGRQFHAVHREWREGTEDPSDPFVTFYAVEPIAFSFYERYVVTPERIDGGTQTLLRSTDDLSPEDVNDALRDLLARAPTEPVMTPDGPETNPELHELLNEVRKRPGVSPELNDAAIRARVGYYLAVARVFTPDSPWWDHPSAAKRKRDLAIGIGWFARNKSEALGDEMLGEAKRAPIVRLLAEGLIGLERHNRDLDRALVTADETRETALFIFENHLGTPTDFIAGFGHALNLARCDGRLEIIEVWTRASAVVI